MINSTRKVWINPVERVSAQGRDRQYYQTYNKDGMVVSTMNMKKTREYDTGYVVSFPYDINSGKIYTGLQETILNPLKGLTQDEITEMFHVHSDYVPKLEEIAAKDKITKQQFYEIKHGKAPNDYNNEAGYTMLNLPTDIKDFDKGKGELAKLRLILYPRPNMLKSDTPRQELLILMVEALVKAGKIAPSKDMANPSVHEFYISEDNQEEQDYARRQEYIENAVYNLVKLKKEYPYFRNYQFATILKDKKGNTLITGESTPERVKTALSLYVNNKHRNQIFNIEQFNNLFSLMQTPEGADRLKVMYLVQQAINTGIFQYRNKTYVWPSKSHEPDVYELGSSQEKVVTFFFKESQQPEPKGKKIVVNYYKDLRDEVKSKNILLE